MRAMYSDSATREAELGLLLGWIADREEEVVATGFSRRREGIAAQRSPSVSLCPLSHTTAPQSHVERSLLISVAAQAEHTGGGIDLN